MENVKKWIDMLGFKVEDKITGFKGVATSTSFDLYGCVQIAVDPGLDKDGKPGEGKWLDVSRLKISSKRVMEAPEFDLSEFQSNKKIAEGNKGSSKKSIPNNF